MAGNRRRKQDNSGVHAFLYVLVVLVLLCGMGYLFLLLPFTGKGTSGVHKSVRK